MESNEEGVFTPGPMGNNCETKILSGPDLPYYEKWVTDTHTDIDIAIHIDTRNTATHTHNTYTH